MIVMGMTRELRSNTRMTTEDLSVSPTAKAKKESRASRKQATWTSHGVLSPALSEKDVDQKELVPSADSSLRRDVGNAAGNPLCLSDVHQALSKVAGNEPKSAKIGKTEQVICPPLPVPPRKIPLEQVSGVSRLCSYCGATKTPLWRAGPKAFNILCNRCGIIWKRGRILQDVGSSASHSNAGHRRANSKGTTADAAAVETNRSVSSAIRQRRNGLSILEHPTPAGERLHRRKASQKLSSAAAHAKKRQDAFTCAPPKPYHNEASPLKSYRPCELDLSNSTRDSDALTCSSFSGYSSDAYSEWDSGVSDTEQVPAGMSAINSGASALYRYNTPVPTPVVEPLSGLANKERTSRQRAAYLSKKIESLSATKLLPVVDILRSTPVWQSSNMEGKLERGMDAEIPFGEVSEDVWNKIAKLVGGEPKAPGPPGAYVFPMVSEETLPVSPLSLTPDQFGQTLLSGDLSCQSPLSHLLESDALEEYLEQHAVVECPSGARDGNESLELF